MAPLEELRHSASHILATAILRLWPDAKLDIGPPTETGFYYDIDLDHKFTAEDLVKIEAEMKKVADENQPFLRKEVSREEAVEIIKSRGQERYKLGRLADIPAIASSFSSSQPPSPIGGPKVHSADDAKTVRHMPQLPFARLPQPGAHAVERTPQPGGQHARDRARARVRILLYKGPHMTRSRALARSTWGEGQDLRGRQCGPSTHPPGKWPSLWHTYIFGCTLLVVSYVTT